MLKKTTTQSFINDPRKRAGQTSQRFYFAKANKAAHLYEIKIAPSERSV